MLLFIYRSIKFKFSIYNFICFLDDLDDHHARKYKLVSKFGDLLKSFLDILKT